MIIALFGVSCVGKTTIGKIISDELKYDFYDLDAELVSYYSDSIESIQNSCITRHEYDGKKGIVLKHILDKCADNTIIAVSPIYYTMSYKHLFKAKNVFSVEIQDCPENIAKRVIYTDKNNNIIENPDRNIKAEIKDTKYFISKYKRAFSNIENKYCINGKSAEEAAKEIIETIILNHLV